jgi:hypothetical protein
MLMDGINAASIGLIALALYWGGIFRQATLVFIMVVDTDTEQGRTRLWHQIVDDDRWHPTSTWIAYRITRRWTEELPK